MAEMHDYPPGMPSWVDLGTPDPVASKAFYGALFGWDATTTDSPSTGGYALFLLRDRKVAGVGPLMQRGQPCSWTTYVTVADVDATLADSTAEGGSVVAPAMDVMSAGRMAVFRDPQGAVMALWQPVAHSGAELANEPGAFCWTELATRDLEGAKRFYSKIFGWAADTHPFEGGSYTEWTLDGRPIAGMMGMGPEWPTEVPPHWLVYFATADCQATVATALENRAKVLVPPTDIDPGRFAVLADPQGATFAILQTKQG